MPAKIKMQYKETAELISYTNVHIFRRLLVKHVAQSSTAI